MINLLNKFRIFKGQNKLQLNNKKIFLIALICLIILYIDFNFLIKLQLQGINNLTAKIIKVRKDINNLAKDLLAMQDLKNRQAPDRQQAEAPKPKEIIFEDQIPLLLQDISDLANKNKIKIMQINTARDTKVQEETIAGERLLPLTIKLDLVCTYHSLGSFINDLENARQFVELQEMKIIRDPHNYLIENVNLILKAYAKK